MREVRIHHREGTIYSRRAQSRNGSVIQARSVVEGLQWTRCGRDAKGHSGTLCAGTVENIDGVTTSAETDTGTRVEADLKIGGRIHAEPLLEELTLLACRVLEEDNGLARRDSGYAVQSHRGAER